MGKLRFLKTTGYFLQVFVLCALLVGCASFQKNSDAANSYLKSGEYEKACEVLKPLAEAEGDDQLVYLLDYGVALHLAGQYDESIKVFLKADDIAALKDYTSLSREAGSVLLNEGMVQYKGDHFEKIFIHIYLALNFIMKDDIDGALVEARRVNEILVKYRDEGKMPYEQNHLAFYLSAMLWEAEKNWDSAYIAYHDAFKRMPENDLIKKDLIRASKLASRDEEHSKWKKKFKDVGGDIFPPKGHGEFIFIFQQGRGPKKFPDPTYSKIPTLVPQPTFGRSAKVKIGKQEIYTRDIFSVQDVATKTLKDQYAKLITKRVIGTAAKYVVAHQVSQKNEALGQLTWIGLNLIDQADLRQWSNLPQTFQVARVYLSPGEYELSADALGISDNETGESMQKRTVTIKPGKKTFITWRSFK